MNEKFGKVLDRMKTLPFLGANKYTKITNSVKRAQIIWIDISFFAIDYCLLSQA